LLHSNLPKTMTQCNRHLLSTETGNLGTAWHRRFGFMQCQQGNLTGFWKVYFQDDHSQGCPVGVSCRLGSSRGWWPEAFIPLQMNLFM
jgi:hypothetical protein